MFDVVETLQAPPDESLNLWFEPWAEGMTLPPGMMVELQATSTTEGRLIMENQGQGVAVYAWPGCTLKVVAHGEVVRDFSIPVPEMLPPGMDMKTFVGFLFGSPPTAGGPSE